MKTFTVADIERIFGLEYADAYALVRGLNAVGYIDSVGKAKSTNGKGKGPTLYSHTPGFGSIMEHVFTENFKEEKKEEAVNE